MLPHPICTAREFSYAAAPISKHYSEHQHGARRRQIQGGKPLTKGTKYSIIASNRNERADVAQLVERLIRNQKVGGSNPPIGFP